MGAKTVPHTPPHSHSLPCRIDPTAVSHAFYFARYEESRARSPFNQRIYARRNHADELVMLVGSTRFSKTAGGIETRELAPGQLCQVLAEDIGISDDVIDKWIDSGGLTDSFQPHAGPHPPPVLREPPSRRRGRAGR